MEKLVNPYDKEYMKMAMLKHEEIFREQVYELHRLYQTQKLLMKNLSSSLQRARKDKDQNLFHDKRDVTPKNTATSLNHLESNKRSGSLQCFDLEIRPNDQGYKNNVAESVVENIEDIEDETELELTLGLSSYSCRRNRRKTASDSASSSTGSTSQTKHTSLATNPRDVLTTGGHKWGVLDNLPVSNPSFRQSNPNVEDQFRSQDSMNNPPWLFQVLSLNMT